MPNIAHMSSSHKSVYLKIIGTTRAQVATQDHSVTSSVNDVCGFCRLLRFKMQVLLFSGYGIRDIIITEKIFGMHSYQEEGAHNSTQDHTEKCQGQSWGIQAGSGWGAGGGNTHKSLYSGFHGTEWVMRCKQACLELANLYHFSQLWV